MPSLDDLNIVSLLPIECCSDDYVVSEAQDGKDRVINLLKKKDGIITIKGKLYKIYNKIPKKIKGAPMCIWSTFKYYAWSLHSSFFKTNPSIHSAIVSAGNPKRLIWNG
jgi:hypothetical protein